jgi:hypothetical protein
MEILDRFERDYLARTTTSKYYYILQRKFEFVVTLSLFFISIHSSWAGSPTAPPLQFSSNQINMFPVSQLCELLSEVCSCEHSRPF